MTFLSSHVSLKYIFRREVYFPDEKQHISWNIQNIIELLAATVWRHYKMSESCHTYEKQHISWNIQNIFYEIWFPSWLVLQCVITHISHGLFPQKSHTFSRYMTWEKSATFKGKYMSDWVGPLRDNYSHDWHDYSYNTRCVSCYRLQVISRKRATNYRALLRKMTYNDIVMSI